MVSKCIDSRYLVGTTPVTVFLQLFWNFADVFCMEWKCACGFCIILWYVSSFQVLMSFSSDSTVIIIIIISILEPCFPLPRVGLFWQVFLEGVLSTQNDFEGQQNPYLASFCHSQALHPMISLACQIFFCAITFSLLTSAVQPVLRSTCPNNLILTGAEHHI